MENGPSKVGKRIPKLTKNGSIILHFTKETSFTKGIYKGIQWILTKSPCLLWRDRSPWPEVGFFKVDAFLYVENVVRNDKTGRFTRDL